MPPSKDLHNGTDSTSVSSTCSNDDPTGSKYVPPHLRNSQGSDGGGNRNSNNSNHNDNNYSDRRSSYNDRRGGRGGRGYFDNDRRGGGSNAFGDRRGSGYSGGDRCGSYDSNYSSGPPPTNSRWANVDAGGGGASGGYGGDRRASNSGGGGSYGRSNVARRNERGFHGDMKPDTRLEQRLFDNSDRQSTGINFENYDKIPIEVSGDDVPDPIEEYSVDSIGDDLFRNTQLCGYSKPTPVQKYSVPIGTAGRDLMACAQTGSGKTAGFLFPVIMSMIKTGGQEPPDNSRRRTYPEALVLAPTRELAQQIYDEGRRFTYCTGIAPVVVYGGADVREQLRQIERGCDLLVATPGRLVDLIERGRLAMENVRFLVLDEADRMVRSCVALSVLLLTRVRVLAYSSGLSCVRRVLFCFLLLLMSLTFSRVALSSILSSLIWDSNPRSAALWKNPSCLNLRTARR